MDVKIAFLNGYLEEEVYIDQPKGFSTESESQMVCKLKKSIYGLKQACRQWYIKFNTIIISFGFKKILLIDLYTKRSMGVSLYFWFYMLMIFCLLLMI